MERTEWVVFDVDGVLIDSLKNMENSWSIVCKRFWLSIAFEEYKKHIGKPFEVIMAELGCSHLLPGIKELYFTTSKNSNITPRVYDWVVEVLEEIQWRVAIWIITSKQSESLTQVLSDVDLAKYFDTELIFSPPTDNPNLWKPKPHLGELFMQKTNITIPETVLYIGDMWSDMQFAKNTGFRYLHHTGWYEPDLNLEVWQHIASMREILWKLYI